MRTRPDAGAERLVGRWDRPEWWRRRQPPPPEATPLCEVPMQVSIAYLIGNPTLDAIEIEQEMREDARIPFASGLPDEVTAEMGAAFGYGLPPSGEEIEA